MVVAQKTVVEGHEMIEQPEMMKTDDDLLELLDDIGLTFALHTHHPLTHLEYGADQGAAAEIGRSVCP